MTDSTEKKKVPCLECHHPDGAPRVTNLVGRCPRCHGTGKVDAPLPSKTVVEELREALQAASEHLDYCGYGDSWERECARDSKLQERIEAALKRASDETFAVTQLKEAHEAVWAMAEDGWLYHGSEGMNGAQQTVSDYTRKYPRAAVKANEDQS